MEKKNKSPAVDRIGLQWLLAVGAMACAPLVTELPLWVTFAFALSVGWRYAIERFGFYRPGQWVRYGLVLIVCVGVFQQFGTLLGRDPGLGLLVTLLGLKLLELRTVRDAMFTLFLFYVVLVGGFLFGQTLITALWAIGCVLVSVIALARLQQQLPARVVLRLAGELVLKAVPVLIVLYVLFPRVGGTLWGVSADSGKAFSGIPDEIQPGTINELSISPDIALRADFINGALPAARELYWRGLVLWESDGKTWKRGAAAASLAGSPLRSAGSAIEYRITLEPSNKRWLFTLDLPATRPKDTFSRPDFTFSRPEPIRERISYDVVSHSRYATAEPTPAERSLALAVPPLSARVRAFADELRKQHADPGARVQAVLEHIRRENFVYTLTPPMLGNDPVDQFFFETRRGFCEHYASTFATLMRAADVPARIVIGYQGGELNVSGNYLIVRQADAHAWVEVALPGRGWVRVDPTAAVAPERVELGIEAIRRLEAQGLVAGAVNAETLARVLNLTWFEQLARQARWAWDYTNIAWYRFVVDYRKEKQESLLQMLGFETIEWSRILTLLGGSCALVLLIYVAWSRRVRPLDPTQRWYARFCRKLARVGLTRAAHEGPLDFCERASAARRDLAPHINAITASYIHIRYHHNAGNDDLRALKRAVRALRASRSG